MLNFENIMKNISIPLLLFAVAAFYITILALIIKAFNCRVKNKKYQHTALNKTEFSLYKGKMGEYKIAGSLASLGRKYFVINDVMIETNDRTSQIDHIVISPHGIFVIETKNYSGILRGAEYDTYVSYECGANRYIIYNPLKQNRSHIRTLMQALGINNKNLFIPILAISDRCICDIEAKTPIVSFSSVCNAIWQFDCELLTDTEVNDIFQKIHTMNIADEKERVDYVERVRLLNECPF